MQSVRSATTGPPRILIVDDDHHNRQLLAVMLGREGFTLTTASSGEEALAAVALEPPDLILLDVMMPGMDGYAVAGSIKRNPATQNIPVIMVTAKHDQEARMVALSAGAEDFLTKPVAGAELCVRVRNLLRLKAYGDYHDRYSQMLEQEVGLRTAELLKRTEALELQAAVLSEQAALLDLAQDAIVVLDLQSRIVFWSRGAEVMYGWPAAEAVGQNLHRLLRTESTLSSAPIDATLVSQDHGQQEETHYTREGTKLIVASRSVVQRDAAGLPVRIMSIGTDVTDRKLLEAQLRQSQKMDAVGQLAGGMAHDFNNLLTAILGYSNLVLETFDADDPRRSDLGEVLSAGRRAAALTSQLLAFSRKQVLQPVVVDLNALVSGMREMLSRLIGEHVEFIPILANGLGSVRADPGQLEQVLMNLVVNARDAMPTGGRLAVQTANVMLDQSFMRDVFIKPGAYVMLAVCDSGTGMSEAVKQRLFEPFFTTKELGKGTGLGLATVYGIVKQSEGYIWAFSEPGAGATFKVFLPRCDEVGKLAPSLGDDTEVPIVGGSETILVVEDEAAVRWLTRRILEQNGYLVFTAAEPLEAEALFNQHGGRFDLLVTDVVMPGSSGPALFARLVAQHPALRVLYVSGYTDDTIVHQGQLNPGIELLQKPFTSEALNRRVREILEH